MELNILFEDGEALVIDKPAGLPLDRPRAGGPCLEDELETLKLGFQREPFPVHRLDRDTSGCLLLARNPKALKRFSAAFEARTVAKRYLGVVAGPVEGETGTIELALSKISSAADGWRMIAAKKGKPAVTHWRKIDEKNGMTLVEFRPETGRTHQIRVHALLGLGAALLGDPIYGDDANGSKAGAKRTLLHAIELTIPRDGKPPIHAIAPVPADFVVLGFDLSEFALPEVAVAEIEASDLALPEVAAEELNLPTTDAPGDDGE
jgi:tRNA pseudouridine32 synthase/23S rRNA pseudouridine746 synthase